MELFAPDNLPGVGMGSLQSIVALFGLIGLAVTSGMLVAQGLLGTIIFTASALFVLNAKPDLGGAPEAAIAVLVVLVLLAILRLVIGRGAAAAAAGLTGAAADAPETRAARAKIARRGRTTQRLAILAVLITGGAVGFAWAEWNEVPFRLEDLEAVIGLAIGFVAASIGGDAAWRFLQGAVRAGGSVVIVGIVVCVVALLFNAASVYVPFAGLIVLLLAGALSLRLRRRQEKKNAGLRILS
ncbi:MAG: hypothetical protein ABI200_04920 [Gaiellales bacterium]